MTRMRRRLVVTVFAGVLGMFGALDVGAAASPGRTQDRTETHDLAKRNCKNRKTREARRRCRQRQGGQGDVGANCHSSYPDFCIVPPPPDKDCADVGGSDFTVVGTDPHGFDGDNDGIGCES